MNILIWLMIIIEITAGLASTGYIVVAMPAIFIWKVYRKYKYHISLND